MAKYRTIRIGIWSDPYFERLSMNGKFLYLYLITSSNTNSLGVLTATIKKMSFETDIPAEQIKTELVGFERDGKVVTDGETVYLRNFIKNQCHISPTVLSCLRKEADDLESNKIRNAISEDYPNIINPADRQGLEDSEIPHTRGIQDADTMLIPHPYPIDTPSIPHTYPIDKQELELRQEQELELELRQGQEQRQKIIVDNSAVVSASDVSNTPTVKQCPHKEIIALYHEILPTFPQVKVWSEQRRTMLQKRWREDASRQSLEWWRDFFTRVSESDFLCGRIKPVNFTLEWLIRPTNFINVLEGKYRNFEEPHKTGRSYDEIKADMLKKYGI